MKKQIAKFTIDTSVTFVAKILGLVLGIGTSIIIARVLGPQGKGIYSLAILLPSLLASFGNLGIGQASVFHVGKKTYSPKEILGSNIILAFLLGIIGCLVGLIIVSFFSDSLFPGVAKIYLLSALFLVPLGFLVSFGNCLLLGLQKIKEFNFINIVQSFVLLVLLLFLLLVFKFRIEGAIVANILASLVTIIVLLYLTKKIIGVFHLCFNSSYVKDAFRYGFKVCLGNSIQFLHYRIDIFLVNIFLNPIAVGFYSIAVTLAEKIWLLSQSAGIVLFPRVSSETDERRLKEFTPLVCRNVLLITLIGATILYFLGRLLIILLYSEKFSASVSSFQILLVGAVTISGWKLLANDLYGRGRPELNVYISLVSAALNVVLNIIWIPKFGIAGAAWATSASYTFAFVAITIVYSKISGNGVKDIIFIKRSDFKFYRDFLKIVRNRIKAFL